MDHLVSSMRQIKYLKQTQSSFYPRQRCRSISKNNLSLKVIHQIDLCTLSEREIEWVEQGLSGSRHTKSAQLLATFDSDESKFKWRISSEEFQYFISDLYFTAFLQSSVKNVSFMATKNKYRSPVLLFFITRAITTRQKI